MIKQKTTALALKEKKQISVINIKQNVSRAIKRDFSYQSSNIYNKLNLNTIERRDFYDKIFSIK